LIAPQVWDTDTPQVGEGTTALDPEVDIMTFKEEEIASEPVVPQPPRKSPKEKRKKRKRPATRESKGRFVIRLKTPGSTQSAEAIEEERRPGSTAEILSAPTVHSAKDGAILAAEAASIQEKGPKYPYQLRMRCSHRLRARSLSWRQSAHRRLAHQKQQQQSHKGKRQLNNGR
jgi:hypothetical protein